jgi:hypothetical protein
MYSLFIAATSRYCGQMETLSDHDGEVAAQTLQLVPDAVNAVLCAPDDG